MAVTLAPSLTSRTVPMNDATAPTRRSFARNAAISRPASKSSVVMRTVTTRLSAGHGRKKRDFVAVAERCIVTHDVVVHRDAKRATGRKLARPRLAPRAQRVKERAYARPGSEGQTLVAAPEGLAQAGEVDQVDGDADGGVRRVRHELSREDPREIIGPSSEPELQTELDLVVLGKHAGRKLARQAAQAGVLEAQAERGRHVVTQAQAVVDAIAIATHDLAVEARDIRGLRFRLRVTEATVQRHATAEFPRGVHIDIPRLADGLGLWNERQAHT